MGDAGAAETEQDLDFGVDRGFSYGTTFDYSGPDYGPDFDPDFAREKGISAPSYDLDLTVPELKGILTRDGGGGGEVESPVPPPEVEELKTEVAEETEARPVITRGKRRRSLLTEEEGGVLRKAPVYRRSILGR